MSRLLLLFLFCIFPVYGAVAPLYVVHSNPPNKWSADLDQGLKASLSPGRFSPSARYFFHNTYWLSRSAEEQKSEKQRILNLIRIAKPAAVLLCDDEANEFLARDLVGAGYRVFTIGVNRLPELTSWRDLLAANKVAGVFETWPWEKALTVWQNQFPKRKRFSIFTSATGTSDRIIEIMQTPGIQSVLRKNGQVLRKIYRLQEWEGWKSALSEANKQDDFAWFLIPYGVFDRDNVEVTPGRMIQWLKANVSIPSIGSSVLDGGVSISIGVMAEKMAVEVGDMVEATLQNRKAFGGAVPSNSYRVKIAAPKP